MMIKTFGAPSGGRNCLIGGYFVSGSLASYVTRPVRGRSGMGRTLRCNSSRLVMDTFLVALVTGRPVYVVPTTSPRLPITQGGRHAPRRPSSRRGARRIRDAAAIDV